MTEISRADDVESFALWVAEWVDETRDELEAVALTGDPERIAKAELGLAIIQDLASLALRDE